MSILRLSLGHLQATNLITLTTDRYRPGTFPLESGSSYKFNQQAAEYFSDKSYTKPNSSTEMSLESDDLVSLDSG